MRQKLKPGFTLIELLVVIAIIALLAAVVLSSLDSARQKGKIAAAKAELTQIRTAMSLLADDTNQWPGHQPVDTVRVVDGNEIWDLNPPSSGLTSTDGSFPNWHGPYIGAIPLDPWGKPYFLDTDYHIDANNNPCPLYPNIGCMSVVTIGSFGPNGGVQDDYDSDDIIFILAR